MTLNKIPKALAIHDMSGFGRCALTVVIPVMSAFGIQVVPVPTALLSTHTGGFTDFAFCDMTDFMVETLRHYKELKIGFDCIYSGFLGNENQAEITAEYIKAFGGDGCLKVVDPAFADDGELYSTINPKMIDEMSMLVTHADLTTPNFTEAAFLLGYEPKGDIDRLTAEKWVKELSGFGPAFSVITGVPVIGNKLLTVGYNKNSDMLYVNECERHPDSYPGCGDVFTSFLSGCMLSGLSFEESLDKAALFINDSIRLGEQQGDLVRNGLPFEYFLKKF